MIGNAARCFSPHAGASMAAVHRMTGRRVRPRLLTIIPIGGADMPVVISYAEQLLRMGGGRDRLLAEQLRC
jgi:NAD/NADP transhydrogenase beta subunit